MHKETGSIDSRGGWLSNMDGDENSFDAQLDKGLFISMEAYDKDEMRQLDMAIADEMGPSVYCIPTATSEGDAPKLRKFDVYDMHEKITEVIATNGNPVWEQDCDAEDWANLCDSMQDIKNWC
jgi:hypothetical protein